MDYTALATFKLDLFTGMWAVRYPNDDQGRRDQAREQVAERWGLRQGTVTYTPEEFLMRVSAWENPTDPTILEYTTSFQTATSGNLGSVVAKLYPGGCLTPFANIYREKQK